MIPVIDLLHGRVVHAIGGNRATYRPIDSPLCRRGEVLPLVRRLHHDMGLGLIYIADLDAIEGCGDHHRLVVEIGETFPRLQIWLDGGFDRPAAVEPLADNARIRPVIGSETWSDQAPLARDDTVLSIDSDESGLRDPSGIARDPQRRPTDLILMNLARVGCAYGPDLELLQRWRNQAPDSRLYLAGGVRNRADLERLARDGASGVLLATALHHRTLGRADLGDFS